MTGDDVFDRTQNSFFALLFQPVLKLIVRIKMILDRLFALLVTNMISVMPAAMPSLTTCSITGRS